MAFNIQDIKSALSKDGYQKTSHFACSIIMPAALSSTPFDYTVARCNSVNLPGFNLGTDEYRHKGFGLTEKRPNQASFEDVTVTIIADAQGKIYDALYKWHELIYPIDDSNSDEDVEYFEYPNVYYGSLEIYIYDMTGNVHTTYTLRDVFPTNLSGQALSWEHNDQIMLVPVTFAYRKYDRNTSNRGVHSNFATIDTRTVNQALTA